MSLNCTKTFINLYKLSICMTRNRRVKLGDGLGATEGWSVILLNSGKYLEPYKIGRPIDTLNVKIIDENTGKEVTKGNKGLLCISGPSVMLEYYENEIETSKVMYKAMLLWIEREKIK